MKVALPTYRSIRALLPMACDGVGPSETCLNIMNGAHLAGYPVEVFANRLRIPHTASPIQTSLPSPLNKLPYKITAGIASIITEWLFLQKITKDDVAYVWPAATLSVHKALHEKGVPIVLEGINTRMASAKKVLDAAYAELGLSPSHGITQARIDEEEKKLEYATAIFAPNPIVETALSDIAHKTRIIPTSYGVDTDKASSERVYENKKELIFVFCGYACVRKGIHYLLEAWREMPANCTLQLVGHVEPAIRNIYQDVLNYENVQEVGFVQDVHTYFAAADVFVFPSLEEGGPQVTYEAALHGLPILASPAGASRLGDIKGTMQIVDPAKTDQFLETAHQLANSLELRKRLGQTARAAVQTFDWRLVGARRANELSKL